MSVAVLACGMTTPIGLTGPAACAALRARYDNFADTRFISHSGDWIIGAEVPLDPPRRGRERLIEMLRGPIRECLAAVPPPEAANVPVLICVAEKDRPGRTRGIDEGFVEDVMRAVGMAPHAESRTIAYGRVGGAVAMRDARDLIAKGAKYVIVAGADSLLVGESLSAYDRQDRVLTASNSNGFAAGEAGAAVLVGPAAAGGLTLLGLGFAREEAHVTSGQPLRADGLVAAMRAGLGEAGIDFSAVDYRISDLSGEQYYFKEAALAMTRVLRKRKEQMDIWHPVDGFGHTGAAVLPLILGICLTAGRKGYAPGPTVMAQTADDDGRRGVMILRMEG